MFYSKLSASIFYNTNMSQAPNRKVQPQNNLEIADKKQT